MSDKSQEESKLVDQKEFVITPRSNKIPYIDRKGKNAIFTLGGEFKDLRGSNLSGADLRDAYLYGVKLNDANLSSADLSFANLTNANLNGADLNNANLTGANLHGADLTGVNWDGCIFTEGWIMQAQEKTNDN